MTGTLADLASTRRSARTGWSPGGSRSAYDRGAFALKGDGRVAGAPVTRGPAPAEGRSSRARSVVNLSLDEALRARKGLPVAPQLTRHDPGARSSCRSAGRRAAKPPIRVEADLARAGDRRAAAGPRPSPPASPGASPSPWSTAARRRLELRDLAFDAAPRLGARHASPHRRRAASNAPTSPALKLSPGDDMRVQARAHRQRLQGHREGRGGRCAAVPASRSAARTPRAARTPGRRTRRTSTPTSSSPSSRASTARR